MGIDRIVYIIAAIFGLDYRICTPTRDMQAEGALTRALARNGGDGLTACKEDAGMCPKPCLRHRRVNVGIWPNWRCNWSSLEFSRWHDCPLALPGTTIGGYLDARNCGTYQNHLAREELKRKTAAYIQNCRNQEWDYDPYATPPIFWSNGPTGETVDLVTVFNHQAEGLLRQARNITQNMGVSPLWNRESSEILIEPEPMKWTISSSVPRPFEGKTYIFDLSDPLPAESPQPSSSLAPPSLDASLHQPAPDSEA